MSDEILVDKDLNNGEYLTKMVILSTLTHQFNALKSTA